MEQQRYYVIDRFASEVIEFSRSYEREGILIRGRLSAEMSGTKPDGTSLQKSSNFKKWFDSWVRWIRRNYAKDAHGDYVGAAAARFKQQGGTLRQADFAPAVKIVRH